MSRTWTFLPEEATPFMLAALNAPPTAGDTEALGENGDVLARLPHSSRAGPREATVR